MSKGVHRVTPNSKTGRSMIKIAKTVENTASKEVVSWNEAVEKRKAESKLRKLQRKG